MIFVLLKNEEVKKILNTKEWQFSLLLSALCHDLSHTGKTNSFEENTFSKLALKYNDESV